LILHISKNIIFVFLGFAYLICSCFLRIQGAPFGYLFENICDFVMEAFTNINLPMRKAFAISNILVFCSLIFFLFYEFFIFLPDFFNDPWSFYVLPIVSLAIEV
jgi:hypothetical protein